MDHGSSTEMRALLKTMNGSLLLLRSARSDLDGLRMRIEGLVDEADRAIETWNAAIHSAEAATQQDIVTAGDETVSASPYHDSRISLEDANDILSITGSFELDKHAELPDTQDTAAFATETEITGDVETSIVNAANLACEDSCELNSASEDAIFPPDDTGELLAETADNPDEPSEGTITQPTADCCDAFATLATADAEHDAALDDAAVPVAVVDAGNGECAAIGHRQPLYSSVAAAVLLPAADTVPTPAEIAVRIADGLSASQHLTLIEGVDAAVAEVLNGLGISRFAEIARLNADDVAEIGTALGDRRRLSRQGWIEQACILAAGGETAYARRRRLADTSDLALLDWCGPATSVAVKADSAQSISPAASDVADPSAEGLQTPPRIVATASGTGHAAAVVVDIADFRERRRHRRSGSGRSGAVVRFCVSACAVAVIAAAWTGIDLAETDWKSLSALIDGLRHSKPVASLL